MTAVGMPDPNPGEDGGRNAEVSGKRGLESYPHILNSTSVVDQIGPILVRCPVELLEPGLAAGIPYDPRLYYSPVFGPPIVHLDEDEELQVLLGEEYVNIAAGRALDEIVVEFHGRRPRREVALGALQDAVIGRSRPPSELGKLAAKVVVATGAASMEHLIRELGLGEMLGLDLARLVGIEGLCGEYLRAGTLQEGHAVTLCAVHDGARARDVANEASVAGRTVKDLQTLIMHFTLEWERPPMRRFWHRWVPQAEWWQEFHLEFPGGSTEAP